jgi:hypothetical protein
MTKHWAKHQGKKWNIRAKWSNKAGNKAPGQDKPANQRFILRYLSDTQGYFGYHPTLYQTNNISFFHLIWLLQAILVIPLLSGVTYERDVSIQNVIKKSGDVLWDSDTEWFNAHINCWACTNISGLGASIHGKVQKTGRSLKICNPW